MIGLIFGDKSEAGVNAVKESHGLKDIEGFTSIGSFLSMASRKALRCERLVINCMEVGSPQEFHNLRNFLIDHARTTEVVLFGRYFESSDLEVVESYYTYFSEPIYTDYLLQSDEQATVDLVANKLCKGSLDDIRINHSSKKNIKAVVKYGTEQSTDANVSKVGFTAPVPISSKGNPLKSFGFGGKLFGRGKLTKTELMSVAALDREVYVVLQLAQTR